MELIRKIGGRRSKAGNSTQEWSLFFCPYCEKYVEKQTVNGLKNKSCGCAYSINQRKAKRKHGLEGKPVYRVWRSMKKRCYQKGHHSYKNYGANGIKVCEEWKDDFIAFNEWAIANGYFDGLTVDRKDYNGDYTPSNCCFKSQSENSRYTRRTKLNWEKVKEIRKEYHSGQTVISKIAEKYDVTYGAIYKIINNENWVETMTIQLTEEQYAAVEMVKNNNLSILTGCPGTGKTTTVKEIIKWANESRFSVAQCAPTGKAAKRMMEATGQNAMTIHSLLGATMDEGEFVFQVNEDNPLKVDFLVVDEVSMVSNDLMADLMRAIDPSITKVLFVGDQGQLPSVGPGAVLRDMLASGLIPNVQLTQIQRNSGEIVKACHSIHKGDYYAPCSKLDVAAGYNLRHIEATSTVGIQEVIRKIIDKTNDPTSNLYGFDPVWDIQVISPTNSRSALSCDGMNEVLQDQLNPLPEGETQPENFKFRKGDKVIQIKNARVDDVSGNPSFVVNGDMGKIIEIDPNNSKMIVNFFDPDRTIAISKKRNDLLLAYCVTCHRVQGSETPIAIIPVHKVFQYFLNRSWIYTAISRAKVMCFTVGQFQAIELAINRQDSEIRQTRLKENIVEMAFDDL